MKNSIKKLKAVIAQKENRAYVILIIAAILCMVAGGIYEFTGTTESFDGVIERNDYGGSDKIITAVAETELDGERVSKEIVLNISPEELSEDEIKERFEACKADLQKIILGENSSMDSVVKDLNLIGSHEQTGVRIVWQSSNTKLIDEDGAVYPGESDDNGYVLLTASLYLEDSADEWKCNVRHRASLNSENLGKYVQKGLNDLNESIEADSTNPYVELPKDLEQGITINWSIKKENRFFILALIALILALFVRSKRKSDVKKQKNERKQEIENEFPYFLDKLVMLLSAGLILSEAVERISEDYIRYTKPKCEKVFYDELSNAVKSMKESNSSFSEELVKLSESLDIREFARLSVILRDSLESGMSLADKLEEESVLMWHERKSTVQKLGRLADTKLIFPLMIILAVLIVIVMMPAIMQM